VTEVILRLKRHRRRPDTAHYITDLLRDADVKVTGWRMACPVGGELDYLDGARFRRDPAAHDGFNLYDCRGSAKCRAVASKRAG